MNGHRHGTTLIDPNTTLANIRALVRDIRTEPIIGNALEMGEELAEHITALDEWLGKGGFPPAEWVRNSTIST